ncbi:hypothetical protein BSKO_01529 [Bryopsis sp. KO-2023]|nr:hypothetical protein BSKO_01529 [Bryopsis sp. KO-2023]
MPEAGVDVATTGDLLAEGSSEDVGSLDEWLGEDEDDASVCRICRMPSEADSPLFHPCRCSGSIKYVHEPCLMQWLNHSGKAACEVCGHEFSFTPIYAEDAPPRLPLTVLIWGAVKKGLSAAVFLQRALMVWVSWLVILPVTTCFMWRIAFAPAKMADSIIRSRMTPMALLFDCIQGSLLTALLFILMMMLTYVKDHYDLWITRLEELFEEKLRTMAGSSEYYDDSSSVTESDIGSTLSMEAHRSEESSDSNDNNLGRAPALDGHVDEGNGGIVFGMPEDNAPGGYEARGGDPGSSSSEGAGVAAMDGDDQGGARARNVYSWKNFLHGVEAWMNGCARNFENRLNRLEERLHARLNHWEEMVQDRLRQWEENIQNHLDQLEERVEERINQFDQPFERVLGLQGPLHNIFLNMSAVILFCGMMISVCVWVPLRWGWVITVLAKWFGKTVAGLIVGAVVPMLKEIPKWQSMISYIQGGSILGSEDGKNSLSIGKESFCPVPTFESMVLENQCFEDGPIQMPKHPLHLYSLKILSEVEAQLIPPDASELLVVSVGWTWILMATFVLMWLRSAWQVWARNGREHVHETGVSFSRWLWQTVLGLFVAVKMSIVIVLELIVFPAGFGYWLHLCMLPVFKATTFREVTFVSLLFHWLCGMGFLLGFTSLVRLSREVLRPGALPFLKDPTRPDRDPFAEMASEPFLRQMAGWLFSCVVYSALGVVLLHIPARLARYTCTHLYPVKILFGEVPVSQLPIDLLLFHMFLPFTVEHFMRSAVRDNMRDWLVAVSASIGLEEYLLAEDDYQRFAGRRQEPWTGIWALIKWARRDRHQNDDAEDLQLEDNGGVGIGPESPVAEGVGNGESEVEGEEWPTPFSDVVDFIQGDEEVVARENSGEVEGSSGQAAQRDTVELENEPGFGIRLGLLAVLWGVSMMACHTAMLVVPVVLGRGLCKGVFGIPSMPYDLFASYVGMLTLCAVLEATRGAVNFGAREDVRLAVQDGMEGVLSTLKVCAFAVCWIGVAAFLAGLLVEIVQRPMKVLTSGEVIPVNMPRVWGSGVILLLMWHVRVSRLQRANPQGPVQGHPLNQELALLHEQGLWRMDLGVFMYRLIIPVVGRLLTALLLPWWSSKLLKYALTLPVNVSETIELNAHLVCFVCWVVWRGFAKIRKAVHELETAIRDDHYLVRQELNNFNQLN